MKLFPCIQMEESGVYTIKGLFGMAPEQNSRLELALVSQTPQLQNKLEQPNSHGVIGALFHFLGAPLFPSLPSITHSSEPLFFLSAPHFPIRRSCPVTQPQRRPPARVTALPARAPRPPTSPVAAAPCLWSPSALASFPSALFPCISTPLTLTLDTPTRRQRRLVYGTSGGGSTNASCTAPAKRIFWCIYHGSLGLWRIRRRWIQAAPSGGAARPAHSDAPGDGVARPALCVGQGGSSSSFFFQIASSMLDLKSISSLKELLLLICLIPEIFIPR